MLVLNTRYTGMVVLTDPNGTNLDTQVGNTVDPNRGRRNTDDWSSANRLESSRQSQACKRLHGGNIVARTLTQLLSIFYYSKANRGLLCGQHYGGRKPRSSVGLCQTVMTCGNALYPVRLECFRRKVSFSTSFTDHFYRCL